MMDAPDRDGPEPQAPDADAEATASHVAFRAALELSLRGAAADRPQNVAENRPDSDLAVLLRRCRTGDRAAYNDLASRFYPRILRLGWHFLGNRHDAEEVAQDTFLQALLRMPQLADPDAFPCWLSRIATNLCMKRLQRRNRWSWVPLLASLWTAPRELEAVDQRVSLTSALEHLTPPLRAVVLLRDVLDHTYQDIARILDINEGTVKSRLNAARTQLKRHLAGEAT